MTDQRSVRSTARVGGLVWAAWAVAIALIAGLAVAVLVHLRSKPAGMAGMGHSMSESFYRVGGANPHGPLLSGRLITAWQLDAVALAVLLVLAAWYLTSAIRMRASGSRWPAHYTLSFLAGLAVCGLATNASIAVYDQSLFSAHMIGHLMLVMLAPALLVAGRPLNLLVESSDEHRRNRITAILRGRTVSLLTAPPVALASYIVVIVATHLTGLMDLIMRTTWAGQVEHLAYVLLGCQFFVVVIGDAPLRWRLSVPARFFMLALSMAVDTFTGLVLLQSSTAVTMSPPPGASINPLTDTQTGGAIMWFGGDGIMAVIMVIIAIGWVSRPASERVEPAGWLEQARRASFAAHTGNQSGAPDRGSDSDSDVDDNDFDDDEQRLQQYNDWLRRLNSPSNS